MSNLLDTSIEYLKGVGPMRAEALKNEVGIFTFRDLLEYYPFRYVDRSKYYKVNEINSELPYVQILGAITDIKMVGGRGKQRLTARFYDDTGDVELVWFKGARWIKPTLKEGEEYVMFGKPNAFKGKYNIPHPELELKSNATAKITGKLQPVYNTTEKLTGKGLHSKGIEKLQQALLKNVWKQLPETLSPNLINDLKLLDKKEAVLNIHFPKNAELLQKANFRLKFEELFYIQLGLLKMKVNRNEVVKGFVFEKVGDHFNQYFNEVLPFELTNAQKRVVKEIRKDVGSGKQMNRLLQGDVGSGKTVVAMLSILLAIDNGYQTALMAPTEILANQHYESIAEQAEQIGLKVGLLTGSVKTAARKVLHEQLESGELNILIGTHALIEDKVKFKNLGLAVIDEQHRFGVKQRAKLSAKKTNGASPHILVMTATPIPRTLAMTFYGDLDVSLIDELPPGRKLIKTLHKSDVNRLRVFGFMKEEIAKGRQVYIVYPLIKESEKMDYKDLQDGYESIVRAFPSPQYQVSIVHGQMKPDVKDYEMQRFVKGETQIMVATTVIEVGVNVPNASVMVVESAERFGLSQLHQLRGRVGRGAEQSYCILMTGHKLSNDAKLRMETMTQTNDGFEIAEVDLKLRGPGNLMGTQQSGIVGLKLADLARDGQILQAARNKANELLNEDPNLKKKENHIVATQFKLLNKKGVDWSRIA